MIFNSQAQFRDISFSSRGIENLGAKSRKVLLKRPGRETGIQKGQGLPLRCVADLEHPEPVGMQKFDVVFVPRAQFLPKPPDPEVRLAHIGVMEKDHRPARQFGQPGVEIVAHRFIGMQTVNVQQVDGGVAEPLRRLVESHAQQG